MKIQVPGCRHTLLIEEERITNSAQVWRPGRRLHIIPVVLHHSPAFCSWYSQHPGPGRLLAWGPGLLDWPMVAKGYILLIASSSPWRLQPANQSSKVFLHSVACSRASSPDLVLKNRRPEPPAGNSGVHRGTPRHRTNCVPLLPASRGVRAAGGFRGLANGEAGGSAPLPGAVRQPPTAVLPAQCGQRAQGPPFLPPVPRPPATRLRPSLQPASRSPSQAGIG